MKTFISFLHKIMKKVGWGHSITQMESIPSSFCEKVHLLFKNVSQKEPIELEKAVKKIQNKIEHYKIAFNFSRAWPGCEMNVLMRDYAFLQVSRSVKAGLDVFKKERSLPLVERYDRALRVCRDYILTNVYVCCYGKSLKDEESVIDYIREHMELIASVTEERRHE